MKIKGWSPPPDNKGKGTKNTTSGPQSMSQNVWSSQYSSQYFVCNPSLVVVFLIPAHLIPAHLVGLGTCPKNPVRMENIWWVVCSLPMSSTFCKIRFVLSAGYKSANLSCLDLLYNLWPRSRSAVSFAPPCLLLTDCSTNVVALEPGDFVDVNISFHMVSCSDLSFLVM